MDCEKEVAEDINANEEMLIRVLRFKTKQGSTKETAQHPWKRFREEWKKSKGET